MPAYPHKILPVFVPFAGCRNRCIYCNQLKITGQSNGELIESARRQIDFCLSYSGSWNELAFYGGSFTLIPQQDRLGLYNLAHEKGFTNLRFSTSPNGINEEVLLEAESYGVKTIELGVQSLSDKVLKLNKRPYDSTQCFNALSMLKDRFTTGVQIMTAMYGETAEDVVHTVDTLLSYSPTYARVYPTVVLADTELENLLRQGTYLPPVASDVLLRTAYAYSSFASAGTNIIRTGLQHSDDLVKSIRGGFYHPATGDLIRTLITLIYLNKYGPIYTNQANAHKLYGYKALARKHFPDKIIIDESSRVDFRKICAASKEHIFENNGRNPERNSASYACELVSQTND